MMSGDGREESVQETVKALRGLFSWVYFGTPFSFFLSFFGLLGFNLVLFYDKQRSN